MSSGNDDTIPPDDMEESQSVGGYEQDTGGRGSSSEPTQRIRKGRGKNKRNWAIDGPEPMIFNKNGVAIGSRYCKLNRFIADVGRDLPVDIPNWKLMPRPLLQMAWERIADRIAWTQEQEQIKWKVREVAEIKLCAAWKGYKTRLRDQHYKSDKREPSRFNPPCESIDPDQWKKLVELWDSPHYQEIQNTNRDNRHQLDFSHCTGTKPFAVVEEEYRIKHQTSPDRPKLYELTRTKNQDCEHWVDEGSYRHWEEITSELSKEQPESLNTREVRDAAFQKVFGQRDGRSRVFGAGCGVRPEKSSSRQERGNKYNEILVRLDAQQKALEEAQKRMEEERGRLENERISWESRWELQRKMMEDFERRREIEQARWMEEGARRYEHNLREQVQLPPSLQTPPSFYEFSEYMRPAFYPLARSSGWKQPHTPVHTPPTSMTISRTELPPEAPIAPTATDGEFLQLLGSTTYPP